MSGGLTSFLFQGSPPPAAPTGSDASSGFPLWLQQYIYDTASGASNLASTPYTPFPGPQVYSPSAQTQQAWNTAGSNVGNYQPLLNQATTGTTANAAPISNSSISGYENGYAPGVLGTANQIDPSYQSSVLGQTGAYAAPIASSVNQMGGALTAGVNNSTQSAINGYLNPYTQNVIGGIESSLNQNLEQNVLPQIRDQSVAAGQVGSPQQDEANDRAVYLNQQALGQAVAPALSQGYNTALSAAQGATNTGYGIGASGYGQALSAGQTGAQTGLGLGSTGYTGALSTSLAEQQAGLAGSGQLGTLGALTQQLGANDVSELAGAGQAQDVLSQANINAAVNNFQQQQQWPYQNLGYASDIIRGLPVPTTTQTASTTIPSSVSPSPLATGIGTATLANSLLKKGGRVRAAYHGGGGALTARVR